jgi:hypothetical protein
MRRTLDAVIQRPDEIAEALAMYWGGGKRPIPHQMKLGLADAFRKFDAYALGKYKSEGKAVTLRDALFLIHANPLTKTREKMWKKLVDGTLKSPDTWEVALSSGADKRATFMRLMGEGKLGAMATLRNLRLMESVGVPTSVVKEYLKTLKVDRVLPYRFFTAARVAPQYEAELEELMFQSLAEKEKLPGTTILLVDVSGSMEAHLSDKSEVSRMEAAAALAAIGRELGDTRIFAFGTGVAEIPARRGMALVDAARQASRSIGGGTMTGAAVRYAVSKVPEYDRIVIITDGQSQDQIPSPDRGKRGYIINVAAYRNGIGYGEWSNIDGFSAAVFDWVLEFEKDLTD